MHVFSITSLLSLDSISNSNSPINPNPNPNSQFVYNNQDYDWSYLVQPLITVLILGLGFLYLLRSIASKYFINSGDISMSTVECTSRGGGHKEKEGCAVCRKSTTLWCSACKTVYYCSRACQSRHWKSEHKRNCKGSSGKPKSQECKDGKRSLSVDLVASTIPVKLVDKVLFPYDEFVKLFNWDLPASPPCGLLNCGNSCFANVVLQCLTHTRPLVAYLLAKGHRRDCRRNEWCFLCELEAHMGRARKSQQPFSPITILSRLPTMGGNMGHGRQEDAHEFMRFAIDMMQSVCLDEHGGEKVILPKSQETTLIQHIFSGQLRSQVRCTRCNHVSNRYENLMDLIVEIQGDATSMQECLDQFTETEFLHGENMYKCDRCKDYVIARKRLTINQAPNILTITLKRFQGGNFGKINKKVTFPEILDLCPYMSEKRDCTDKFELYAVVVHMDMLNASFFGHYICYTKSFQGDWYWIDDCKVTRVDLDEVLSQGAYMLLYRRILARPNCLKSSEATLNNEGEVDKTSNVGDKTFPSQLPSSSNSLEPSTPPSIVAREPLDRVSEGSNSVLPGPNQPSSCELSEPTSDTKQQLDITDEIGATVVVKDASALKVVDSVENAENSCMVPAEQTAGSEPSCSSNDSEKMNEID